MDEQHYGQRLNDIRQICHGMLDNVLFQARGDLAGNDLGLVVIQHDALHNPIIVPLRTWDKLIANMVMETIEKVLNSPENLQIDDSLDITVGSIDLERHCPI